jgi:hypothetical protein
MNYAVMEISGTKLAHGIIENKLAACVNQIPGCCPSDFYLLITTHFEGLVHVGCYSKNKWQFTARPLNLEPETYMGYHG